MDSADINTALVAAIKDSPVPSIDADQVKKIFGVTEGEALTLKISDLVREAVAMPIEWGDMTLAEGVTDILLRFHGKHPDLSDEALHQIGRCVAWNLR